MNNIDLKRFNSKLLKNILSVRAFDISVTQAG